MQTVTNARSHTNVRSGENIYNTRTLLTRFSPLPHTRRHALAKIYNTRRLLTRFSPLPRRRCLRVRRVAASPWAKAATDPADSASRFSPSIRSSPSMIRLDSIRLRSVRFSIRHYSVRSSGFRSVRRTRPERRSAEELPLSRNPL